MASNNRMIDELNKPTLYDIIVRWWGDAETQDKDPIIDDLVDMIDKQFIPPSHDTNGYGWEKCLKMMRDNLR